MRQKIFLTFDIDWASDEMVLEVIDDCLKYNVKATFFVTHESETLKKLFDFSDHFEVGIHPNFLPGSTQGNSEEEILHFYNTLLPSVGTIRTHCLYQYSRLFAKFNLAYNNKLIDSSIFMPFVKNIQPFKWITGSGYLVRVPFFWSDDYYFGCQSITPLSLLDSTGCKVYNFHPIHISNNITSIEHYEAVKAGRRYNKPLLREGVGELFRDFLKYIVKNKLQTGMMEEFLQFELDLSYDSSSQVKILTSHEY